jgi:alkylhydroperoxidase family enzyme
MADDVQVENRRLDASENEALTGMARIGADAFGYTADLRMTATSPSSSACEFHSSTTAPTASTCTTRRRARRASPGRRSAWWETELHSEAEQAALRYTEALTRAADTDRDAAFQRFHDALAENFSREEILEIVGVVVNMNVWTRIKLAEGAMPAPT